MYVRIAAVLRLHTLARRADLDDRATVLTLFARFTDELCSGLLVVLSPTLRRRLGLTVPQLAWCFQALASAGLVTEPLAAVAVDVVRRRPLLVAGATGWAAALLLAAGAASFGWLLAAFALAGAAYGPLANTADILLIEGHPWAEERIASRSTVLDSVGALLAPAGVAAAAALGADPRWLLVAAGGASLLYATAFAGTIVPGPPLAPARHGPGHRTIAANVRAVLRDGDARRWIVALLLVELFEPLEVLEPVWLRDVAGFSQAWVGVHVGVATGAELLALIAVDRYLATRSADRLLFVSAAASLLLQPVWLLVPGLGAKLLFGMAREVAAAPLWPVLHARALASAPGRGGAVAAVVATIGAVPIHAGFGWLAGQVGLTTALLAVHLAVAVGLLRQLRNTSIVRDDRT